MAHNTYYPEEVLIEKMECGEYGWLDYTSTTFLPNGRMNWWNTARRTRS